MKAAIYSSFKSRLLLLFFLLLQLKLNAQCGNDPLFVVFGNDLPCGTVITAAPGEQIMFSVHTSDGDNNNEHITLSSGAIPTGAVMSPPLPENDNPPGSTFIWTPTAADTGSYSITFTVTDDCETEVTCSYVVNVVDPCAGPPGAPVFDHSSPACGSTLTATVGVPLSFTVSASDVNHPNNPITLTKSGSSAALANAVLSPPLPLTGNPVSSTFTWTPTLADVGQQQAGFKIHDPCTNGNEYCFYDINVIEPGPPNNNCNNAIPVFCGDTISGTTVDATSDLPYPQCASTVVASPGVWYTLIGNGEIVTLGLNNCAGTTQNNLMVFTGTCGNFDCKTGVSNPCVDQISFIADSGVTYLILINTDNDTVSGTFDLIVSCSPQLPNDERCNATPINCGDTIAGTTVGATFDFGIVNCVVQGIASKGVWYTFTGTGDDVTLSTCGGSNFDTRLKIYKNACSFPNCVGGTDNNCGQNEILTFTTVAGTIYLVEIDAAVIGATGNFTLTMSCGSPPLPDPCIINVGFSGSPGACNDNGTPSDPSDDYFTHNIQASFFNRPSSGSLQIVPGGDVIGSYSIPVNSIIGNQHVFNDVHFKADGSTSNVQMNFTAEPTCIDSATGPAVQSCSTPPVCSINVIFSGSPGACNDNGTPNDPSDDFFTHNIHASFFNRPLSGSLQIVPGGDVIGSYSIPVNSIVGNQHIFDDVHFKADGSTSNVQMNFTAEQTCIDFAAGPAVQPCSPPACNITALNFLGNPGTCNDNGTPNDLTDDFFTQNIQVAFINYPLTGNLQIVPGGSAIGLYSIPSDSIVGNTHTFNNVKLKANGVLPKIKINFTADTTCIIGGSGTTVQPCSTPPPPCNITALNFLGNPGACNDNGTPNDSTDDFFTQDIQVSFINPPLTGNLQIVPGGSAIGLYSIPLDSIVGNTHTFNNVKLKANGVLPKIKINFTADTTCIIGGSGTEVQPCSTPLICDSVVTNDNNPCTIDTCDPATGNVTHTLITIPAPSIVGQNVICTNTQGTYTAAGATGATNYIWTLPPGVTFISGQGTATVVVKFTTACQSGNICVKATNSCTTSSQTCLYIQAISKVPVPGAISGQSNAVCAGSSYQYCIAPLSNASNYIWTPPAHTQIISGQGTPCITLNILAGFTGGKVCVAAQNCKGTSGTKSLLLKNLPPTPGVISGPSSNLCLKTGVVYSIANVNNATSYLWIPPAGANIVLGQGTTTVTVNFTAGFVSGNLTVKAVNACGSGPGRNLALKAKPLTPSSINGPATVCINQQGVPYSVTSVPGVNYAWTVPSGASVVNGQGTANATVNWGVISGNVKVIASNACGAASPKSKYITANGCVRVNGTYQEEESSIIVYPNPATTEFAIEFNAEVSANELLQIISLTGHVIYSERMEITKGKNFKSIDVNMLPSGIYIIKIYGINKFARVIIE